MKKLKILRIITRLNIGGPAIHAALLTGTLDGGEFESRLLCGRVSGNEGDMRYVAEHYGVKPFYVPFLAREINPFADMLALWHIFRHIRAYRPDIVHTHTAKAGTLGRIAAYLAGVPVKVHTFHGNIFRGYFDRKRTRLFIGIERMLAKRTNAVISISSLQRGEIVAKYAIAEPGRCRVVRLGFDLERFLLSDRKKNVFRKKFKFAENDILIGIIGRLVPIKNHKMFIDAACHIMRRAEPGLAERLKFVIVGDGGLRDELALYARFKGLANKMFFPGWIKNIDEVYADMDIVALSSINEGTPVSLIEAMASSKPVVATDVGGVKDALGGIGLLVRPGDYKAMAAKMLELASSAGQREKLGGLGRELVKDIYSKGRLVSELKTLYRELIAERGGR